MEQTYLEIKITNKQNQNKIVCQGEILVDNQKGWFEGLDKEKGDFLFGVFLRPKVIQLYSMDNKAVVKEMTLSRGYTISYEGNSSDNLQIQMLIKSLESDPRDMDIKKEEFKEQLKKFKQDFLVGKNEETYMKYYMQRENISKEILQCYEKGKNDFSR